MPAHTQIVPFKEEYQERCIQIWLECWPETTRTERLPHRDDFSQKTQGEEIFVALTNSKIAGFISFCRSESFIHFLMINKHHRRQNIGKQLLSFAENTLERPIELKCSLENARALTFYRSQNWQEVEKIITAPTPYIKFRKPC